MGSQLVASLDDTDGSSLDIKVGLDADSRRCVEVITKADHYPNTSAGLDPATARAAARALLEAADIADGQQRYDDHDHDGVNCSCYDSRVIGQLDAEIPADKAAALELVAGSIVDLLITTARDES